MDDMSTGAAAEPADLDDTDTEAPAGGADEGGQTDSGDDKIANEAARYRRRLRAAETNLAVAEARADLLMRRDVERLATGKLIDPADIWRDDTDLTGLIGDDGLPSAELVEARAAELVKAHPHWNRARTLTPPASTVTGDGKPPSGPLSPSWGQVLGRRG